MNVADELEKLQQLHQSGGISDDEFAKAKAKLLSHAERRPRLARSARRKRRTADAGNGPCSCTCRNWQASSSPLAV